MAKRARELAVKEKRDRKRARKEEAAALKLTGEETPAADPDGRPNLNAPDLPLAEGGAAEDEVAEAEPTDAPPG